MQTEKKAMSTRNTVFGRIGALVSGTGSSGKLQRNAGAGLVYLKQIDIGFGNGGERAISFESDDRERFRPPGAVAGSRVALLKPAAEALKAPRAPSFLKPLIHSEYRLCSNA